MRCRLAKILTWPQVTLQPTRAGLCPTKKEVLRDGTTNHSWNCKLQIKAQTPLASICCGFSVQQAQLYDRPTTTRKSTANPQQLVQEIHVRYRSMKSSTSWDVKMLYSLMHDLLSSESTTNRTSGVRPAWPMSSCAKWLWPLWRISAVCIIF